MRQYFADAQNLVTAFSSTFVSLHITPFGTKIITKYRKVRYKSLVGIARIQDRLIATA
jgi:hypothetical protein